MAEKQQDLGKIPDKYLEPTLSTADRLVLAHQGRLNLEKAINMVTAMEDSGHRELASLKISRELVQSGRDPIAPPSYFMEVADKRESWNRNNLYENIAFLQANMGNMSSALQAAELTYGFAWFYIDLAKIAARQGADPQLIFDKGYNNLSINAGSTSDVRWAGRTLEAQRELNLAVPKHLIDRFRTRDGRKDDYSNSYNLELAEAYARAGYPEDALEVWKGTTDTGYHHRPETLSIIAISYGKNGTDPSELAANTIELTEDIKSDGQYHPEWKQAEIYANLSRAYALYGLDTQPMIDSALKKALKDHLGLGAEAYRSIAKAQVSFGADARPTLALALERADDILKPDEEDESGFAGEIQVLNWEEIFLTQVAAGYYNDARRTLERMNRYSVQDIVARQAELLAELGKAQAKEGLVQEDINSLSPEDVREILDSDNELVAEAVVYFKLDNRVL